MMDIPKKWTELLTPAVEFLFRQISDHQISGVSYISIPILIQRILNDKDSFLKKLFDTYDQRATLLALPSSVRRPILIALAEATDTSEELIIKTSDLLEFASHHSRDFPIDLDNLLGGLALADLAKERNKSAQKFFSQTGIIPELLLESIAEAHREPWKYRKACESPPEFQIWIDPGEASSEQVKAVLSALSNLNRAYGGNGLIFARDSSQHPIIPSCA